MPVVKSHEDLQRLALNNRGVATFQDGTLRILLAALSGRSTGLGTTLEKYKSLDGSKDRIVVSFDASDNRVTVVLDGTA